MYDKQFVTRQLTRPTFFLEVIMQFVEACNGYSTRNGLFGDICVELMMVDGVISPGPVAYLAPLSPVYSFSLF